MAQRSHVPKFGNWESEDNVPYTVYFDKARKGKTGGKMINPNDPEENPEMFSNNTPPGPRSTTRSDQERHPVAPSDNTSRRTSGGSTHQRDSQGQGQGRPMRLSGGSEHSFERSPLHHQAKGFYESGRGTPGRSKMKPTRVDDSPDRSAVVPRFGEWDENNPSSGDNYTHIFNKVREEHVTGSPMVSGADARPNYNIPRNQNVKEPKCLCFPWFK